MHYLRGFALICGAILLVSCLTVTWAIEGVKGGAQRARYPISANQHIWQNNSVLCYKRVPYGHVLAQNDSGTPYNTIPLPQHDHRYDQTNGYITILDCCEGYKRNVSTGQCDVHCEQGCFGGECTGPNECTCRPGWHADNGVCMPLCSQPCQKDAYCFSPNVCACKLGYDEIDGKCLPICPGGCRNGDCIAPRVCRCKPGYVLNDLQACEAVCEGGCPHGECTAPAVCSCYDGYVNPPNDRESCVPNCPQGCNGGQCISPGVCNCKSGFVRDQNGRCAPAEAPTPSPCRYGCGPHGNCIGPNLCACDVGFRMDPSSGTCLPLATGGQMETTGRDDARYDARYDARCQLPCLNGECTGPNECTCKHGYSLHPEDLTRTRCVPVCIGGCPNGVCTAPGHCLCNPGYRKEHGVKGRQRCVPI